MKETYSKQGSQQNQDKEMEARKMREDSQNDRSNVMSTKEDDDQKKTEETETDKPRM